MLFRYKNAFHFIYIWFKCVFLPFIFCAALTILLQRNTNLLQVQGDQIAWKSDFRNHITFPEKHASWILERVEFSVVLVITFATIKKNFSHKPFVSWHEPFSFLFQTSSVIHDKAYFIIWYVVSLKIFYPSLLPYDFPHDYFSELPIFRLIAPIFCLILESSFFHFSNSWNMKKQQA